MTAIKRASTDDHVLWLAEDGGHSRLIQLPLPHGDCEMGPYLGDTQHGPCEALALTAETEAAGRWVRSVPILTEQPAAKRAP
jgi:hypothetical protein